jgi:nucleoside-diphosphate-sugar epimerase
MLCESLLRHMSKLIFGCGYLGQRVARLWQEAGDDVAVVSRSIERADAFRRQGFTAIIADVARRDSLVGLHQFAMPATVLFAVGFDRTAGQTIDQVYAGGMRNVLSVLPTTVKRFIYISTTGVYGDAAGDWIDAQTAPDPQRDGGRAALAAEHVLAEHPLGKNAILLRLAGLYGPGRVPFLDALRNGEPIPAAEQGHINLIHVEDAARIVLAAGQLAEFDDGPRIFCVSDGQPVRRDEYYREVARQLGAPPPKFTAPDPASPRAARAAADRRVGNSRMLNEMQVSLVYPNYRAGLAPILAPATGR